MLDRAAIAEANAADREIGLRVKDVNHSCLGEALIRPDHSLDIDAEQGDWFRELESWRGADDTPSINGVRGHSNVIERRMRFRRMVEGKYPNITR